MKSALKFLVLFAVTCFVVADLKYDWPRFKSRFNKNYSDPREDNLRKEIFNQQLKSIRTHNDNFATHKVEYSKRLSVTSDFTDNELKKYKGLPITIGPDSEWLAYKSKFKKSYDPKEDALRYCIFQKNMAQIKKHNEDFRAGLVNWKKSLTDTDVMTSDEIGKLIRPKRK